MKTNYTIEKVTPLDASEITSIQNECFDKKWSILEIKTMIDTPHILGYCLKTKEQQIAGYILCQWVLDEGEILSIAIKPALQHKGLGSLLLKEVETSLIQNKTGTLYLEVSSTNTSAKAFYHKHGYFLQSIRPLYYLKFDGSKTDAFVLKKKLFD